MGEARLKGKQQGIRIYRVLGRNDNGPGEGRDEQHVTTGSEGKPARIATGAPR